MPFHNALKNIPNALPYKTPPILDFYINGSGNGSGSEFNRNVRA